MSDEQIRTLLDDAHEAQWRALPPEYHADPAQSRNYKVVTRRDAMPDQEIKDWLKRNDGCRVVGAPPQSLTGRSVAAPVFYVVLRSALTARSVIASSRPRGVSAGRSVGPDGRQTSDIRSFRGFMEAARELGSEKRGYVEL